ncbi:MAG: AAA family ATPase [Bacteroidia bacterium]|nr:AAA family ATPase [Bacteroidia bacterium]
MLKKYISDLIIDEIKFEPTECQREMADKVSEFITIEHPDVVFLLRGYAGTGKTTVLSALVRVLDTLKMKTVLLAPTGRASKVLSRYSGKQATTIHKKIYRQQSNTDGYGKFGLDRNLHTNTIFIIDEASMISNNPQEQNIFGSGYLLSDVIEYVMSGENCRLILAGDTAQLPPVGFSVSPALEEEELKYFDLDVIKCELTQVVRQALKSGILENATAIRTLLADEHPEGYWKIKTSGFKDIIRIGGADLIEEISNCFSKYGIDETIVVTRSNRRSNKFNEWIRRSVLYREEQISTGDLVMIVKNNYYWTKQSEELDFIANGDIAEVVRIKRFEEKFGFHFVNVTLRLIDYKDVEIDCKIILDTLTTEAPSLTQADQKKLFDEISQDYPEIHSKRKLWEKLRENEYFNALQVKFSYAITCHKSQGGQWKAVFLDHGYLTEEMIDREYLRWAYTAFTRPTDRLYLVNFNKEFFEGDEL